MCSVNSSCLILWLLDSINVKPVRIFFMLSLAFTSSSLTISKVKGRSFRMDSLLTFPHAAKAASLQLRGESGPSCWTDRKTKWKMMAHYKNQMGIRDERRSLAGVGKKRREKQKAMR